MKTFHAILCETHNELIVVDVDCTQKDPFNFLIKHRLCKCTVVSWCSSLDAEDNGFPSNLYTYF